MVQNLLKTQLKIFCIDGVRNLAVHWFKCTGKNVQVHKLFSGYFVKDWYGSPLRTVVFRVVILCRRLEGEYGRFGRLSCFYIQDEGCMIIRTLVTTYQTKTLRHNPKDTILNFAAVIASKNMFNWMFHFPFFKIDSIYIPHCDKSLWESQVRVHVTDF
jgi:hypothetical protein